HHGFEDRRAPTIKLDEEQAIAVGELDPTAHLALSSNPTIGPGASPNRKEARPQISRLAAASTIPVTNAAKQENSTSSLRILVIQPSALHGPS
ncbi:MAG TPA: hypothetical protein VE222_10005, partial [Nitrospiraceae bacterium]|nr:hypothetical protein [Nitrospiraceae bacterium]